jgi:hypothetical protein
VNKNKIKILVTIVPLLMVLSVLTGCVAANAIQTKTWDHINDEGTGVRLWGFLKLGENFHNWDGYFVYDTEKHDNWEHYQYTVEADNYDSLNFFSVDVFDLDRTTTYHYRAVGEKRDASSTIRVGVDHTFIPGGPRVAVKVVSDVGIDTAVLEGELTHMGGAAECNVFFRYGTDQNNLDMETPKEVVTSKGSFNYEITGLSSCETYYYRAMAENDADTWSSLYIFHVTPGMPVVATYLPNDVTMNSALFRGELHNTGGPSTCDVWFEYGNKNPDTLDETTGSITLNTTEFFSIEVDGLDVGTTYWVRSVANNGICESRGEIKEFRTLDSATLFSEPLDETDFLEDDDKTSSSTRKSMLVRQIEWLKSLDEPESEYYLNQYPVLKRLLELPFVRSLI